MKNAALIGLAGVGLIGVSAFASVSPASGVSILPSDQADTGPFIDDPLIVDSSPLAIEAGFTPAIDYEPPTRGDPVAPGYNPVVDAVMPPAVDYSAANLVATLALLREGESSDNYTALVGGGNFESFADHPAVLGTFAGISLADGRRSFAAGAYQITKTTWLDIKGKSRWGNFSPASQDAAAIFLIKRRGAYADVLAGRIGEASAKLANEWEFFKSPRWNGDRIALSFGRHGGIAA